MNSIGFIGKLVHTYWIIQRQLDWKRRMRKWENSIILVATIRPNGTRKFQLTANWFTAAFGQESTLFYRGMNGQIKYDFVLKPGAKLESIQFTFDGADTLYLDEEGNIRIVTPLGVLTDEKPFSYQEVDGIRKEIESSLYKNFSGRRPWMLFKPLMAEELVMLSLRSSMPQAPALVYSAFLGGSSDDQSHRMTVDASGNVYVLVYSTFLGGSGHHGRSLSNCLWRGC